MATPTVELTPAPDRKHVRKVDVETVDLPGTDYTFQFHGLALDHAELVPGFRAQEFAFAWIEDGPVAEFLSEYTEQTYGIPNYYKEFNSDNKVYVSGVIRDTQYRMDNDATHFGITDDHVESSVRILSGGGHYTASDYALHSLRGMAWFFMTGPEGVLAISPIHCTPEEFDSSVEIEWTIA